MTVSKRSTARTAVAALAAGMLLAAPSIADARNVRHAAHVNVNHKVNVNRNIKKNVDIDVNRKVHRDIDVDLDVHHRHPVATGVAVGTAAVVTAAALGSIAYSLPPACRYQTFGGVRYYRCGDVWYQQRYSGPQLVYVVVSPP